MYSGLIITNIEVAPLTTIHTEAQQQFLDLKGYYLSHLSAETWNSILCHANEVTSLTWRE